MNDDELRRELERRSQVASFRAEELLPEVRRWTEGGFAKPARFARWAPLAGLAAAALIVLAVIIALPRLAGSPGTTVPLASFTPNPTNQFNCGSNVALSDPQGLATSCIANYPIDSGDKVTASSTMVTAQWMASMCAPIQSATLAEDATVLMLTIQEHSPPYPPNAPSCAGGGFGILLTITLAAPHATEVRASLNGQDLPVVTAEPVYSSPVLPRTPTPATPPPLDAAIPSPTATPLDLGMPSALDLVCDQVFVVDRPIGEFPRTLEWAVYLGGVPNGDNVEWAELTVLGANDDAPARVEGQVDELRFELGLNRDGVVVPTALMVKLQNYSAMNLTDRLLNGYEGYQVTTKPKHPLVNGIYTRVSTTCPG